MAATLLVGMLSGCGKAGNPDSGSRSNHTASVDAVSQCREWSPPADPYDDADEAVAAAAYQACRTATLSAPRDGAIWYRLGTAALEAERPLEATASFHRAERLGVCESSYWLGRAAWNENNAELAEQYYQRGAACGDRRASKELFAAEIYKESAYPDYIAALYHQDMEPLNRVRFLSASYVAGFYEALSEQFLGKDMDPCWTTKYYRGGEILYGLRAAEQGDATNIFESIAYEKSLPLLFHVLFPDQGSHALEEIRQTARKAGHADLLRTIASSHCGALLPHKLLLGVQKFSRSKRSLLEVARQAAPSIHTLQDLMNFLRQPVPAVAGG